MAHTCSTRPNVSACTNTYKHTLSLVVWRCAIAILQHFVGGNATTCADKVIFQLIADALKRAVFGSTTCTVPEQHKLPSVMVWQLTLYGVMVWQHVIYDTMVWQHDLCDVMEWQGNPVHAIQIKQPECMCTCLETIQVAC